MCFWWVHKPMHISMHVHIFINQRTILSVIFLIPFALIFLKQGLSPIIRSAGWSGNSVSKALWLQVHAAISQCLMWAIQIKFTGYNIWAASMLQCCLCIPTQTHILYSIVFLHLEFQQDKRGNMNQSKILKVNIYLNQDMY